MTTTQPRRDSRCLDDIRTLVHHWHTNTNRDADVMLEQIQDLLDEYRPYTHCDACGRQLTTAQRRYCSPKCVVDGNAAAAQQRRHELAAEIDDLLDHGHTPHRILDAIGMNAEAVCRAMYRADRRDLASRFSPLAQDQRRNRVAA